MTTTAASQSYWRQELLRRRRQARADGSSPRAAGGPPGSERSYEDLLSELDAERQSPTDADLLWAWRAFEDAKRAYHEFQGRDYETTAPPGSLTRLVPPAGDDDASPDARALLAAANRAERDFTDAWEEWDEQLEAQRADLIENRAEDEGVRLREQLPEWQGELPPPGPVPDPEQRLAGLEAELIQAERELAECEADAGDDEDLVAVCAALRRRIAGLETVISIHRQLPDGKGVALTPVSWEERRRVLRSQPEYDAERDELVVHFGSKLGAERFRPLTATEESRRAMATSQATPLYAGSYLFRAEALRRSAAFSPDLPPNLTYDWSAVQPGDVVSPDGFMHCSLDAHYAASEFGGKETGALLVIYAPDGVPVVMTRPSEAECNLLAGVDFQIIGNHETPVRSVDPAERSGDFAARIVEIQVVRPGSAAEFRERNPDRAAALDAARIGEPPWPGVVDASTTVAEPGAQPATAAASERSREESFRRRLRRLRPSARKESGPADATVDDRVDWKLPLTPPPRGRQRRGRRATNRPRRVYLPGPVRGRARGN